MDVTATRVLAYASRELDQERNQYGYYDREPPSSDRTPGRAPHDQRQGHYRKKKSWFENLGDIFD